MERAASGERSRTGGEATVYFVSDTTGSLSQTLIETDETGTLIAAYTRADTLICQTRGEETSYYLYDGHGDVRALLNEEGKISDKYRYNAYGELLETSGDTENHYLYTGEYYDGTSNLYYLRARYMNPSTGTFISMDSYEGNIYDPDTLHKYLYANGNPVKYNDPSGNYAAAVMAAGMAINDVVTAAYTAHLMGILSGISNMAINSLLGAEGTDLVSSFFEGYQSGVFTAGVLYLSAAISVKAFAAVYFGISAVDVAMSLVMLLASIQEKNTKATLVYGALTVLALVSVAQAYNLNCSIRATGDKGSIDFEYDAANPDTISVGGSGSDTTKLYRVMTEAEYDSVMTNGKFVPYDRAMEEKWFTTTPEDATKWADIFYPDGNYRMLEIEVDTNALSKMYYNQHLDNIGPAYCSSLEILENAIKSIKGVR